VAAAADSIDWRIGAATERDGRDQSLGLLVASCLAAERCWSGVDGSLYRFRSAHD